MVVHRPKQCMHVCMVVHRPKQCMHACMRWGMHVCCEVCVYVVRYVMRLGTSREAVVALGAHAAPIGPPLLREHLLGRLHIQTNSNLNSHSIQIQFDSVKVFILYSYIYIYP